MSDERRLSKDEYFAVLAKIAGARSICRRHKIGTVIVKDGHIISTGYNGPPRGYTHQYCDPCIKDQEKLASNQGHSLCPATHSEANAIVQAAYQGISTKGGVMYTTLFPCDLCQRLIINAGIVELVYLYDYPALRNMLAEVGMTVRQVEPPTIFNFEELGK